MPRFRKQYVTLVVFLFLTFTAICSSDWPSAPLTGHGKAARTELICGSISFNYPVFSLASIDPRVSIGSFLLSPDSRSASICLDIDPSLTQSEIEIALVPDYDLLGYGIPVQDRVEVGDVDLLSFGFTSTEVCFAVSNFHQTVSVEGRVLTGIGIDLPSADGPFSLSSVTPDPQPGDQNLNFVARPNDAGLALNLPTGQARLDFALLATSHGFGGGNPRAGVQPLCTSSIFCVNGNFSSTSFRDFASHTYILFSEAKPSARCSPPAGGSFNLSLGSP